MWYERIAFNAWLNDHDASTHFANKRLNYFLEEYSVCSKYRHSSISAVSITAVFDLPWFIILSNFPPRPLLLLSNLHLRGFCFPGFSFVSPRYQRRSRNACTKGSCLMRLLGRGKSRHILQTKGWTIFLEVILFLVHKETIQQRQVIIKLCQSIFWWTFGQKRQLREH